MGNEKGVEIFYSGPIVQKSIIIVKIWKTSG